MPGLLRLATLLFAATVFAGCSSLGPALKLFAQGGEIKMRDELRPIRGTTRVLVLAFDGVSDEILRTAISDGTMPRLAQFLGPVSQDNVYVHAYAPPNVVAILPSETAAGWSAVYTGRGQGENGIAGNEWFDRDSLESWAPVPISVNTYRQTLQIYSDDLLGKLIGVPTLFERADVRSHVSMGFVARGADLRNPPDLNDLDDLFQILLAKLTRTDPLNGYKEVDEDTWEGVSGSEGRYGLPDLQVAYFPGVDLTTHERGAEFQRTYLRTQVDKHVGRILDLYLRRGVLNQTYVVIVADHGHTTVRKDDRHSLGGDDDPDEPAALFDTLGYRLREPRIGKDSSDYQAVMAFNEASAFVYLADRSTCPDKDDRCDWSRGPRLAEDVLPLARGFYEASQTGAYVPELQGSLDLVLARQSRTPTDSNPPYRVFDGTRLVPVGAYLAQHNRTDLVALETRLGWLTNGRFGHRGGDLMLLAKNGISRPIEERFYFGPEHESGHGSAVPGDSYIPLIVAKANASGTTLRQTVHAAVGEHPTQLDITNLILSLLGKR